MNSGSFSGSMDMLIGFSPEVIGAFFGKPSLSFTGLKVYERQGGIIAVVFRPGKKMHPEATGYVVYDRSGSVLCANGVSPVNMDAFALESETTPVSLVERYGEPHADIGSGFSVYAYLSSHASLYSVRLTGDNTCTVKEMTLARQ